MDTTSPTSPKADQLTTVLEGQDGMATATAPDDAGTILPDTIYMEDDASATGNGQARPGLTTPHWDQVTVSYRGRPYSPRQQENSVIIPLLNELERQKWKPTIHVPSIRGDLTQAVYHFNRAGVIWLTVSGDRVSWHPEKPRRQR
jgi:hypothetical protein